MRGKIIFRELTVIVVCLVLALSAVLFAACGDGDKVNGITLDRTDVSIETGETVTLTATVDPEGTEVEWSTSAAGVATVSDGVVTAVGAGTATITATAGDKTATCKVTVTEPAVPESLKVTSSRTRYNLGDMLDLSSISVSATMSDGSTQVVRPADCDITLSAGNSDTLELTELGDVTVTFSYEGASGSVKISVLNSFILQAEDRDICEWSAEFGTETTVEGGQAVSNLDGTTGASLTWSFWSDALDEVAVYVNMATGVGGVSVADMFDLRVNGRSTTVNDVIAWPADGSWDEGWVTYNEIEFGTVTVNKGYNEISLVVLDRAGNIDYIALASDESQIAGATEEQKENGIFAISDMYINASDTEFAINPVYGNPDMASHEVEYTFDGDDIMISGGKVKGVNENTVTTVTATTDFAETQFDVYVQPMEYFGELTVPDVTVFTGDSAPIRPTFSTGVSYAVDYAFEGNGISVDGNEVTGNTAGTVTVTATTAIGHTTQFDVTVYDSVSTAVCEAEDIPEESFVAGSAGVPTITNFGDASGGAYLGNVYMNVGLRFTFSVNAEEACVSRLILGMSLPSIVPQSRFSAGLNVYVNDQLFSTEDPIVYNPDGLWEDFDRADLGYIALKEGVNTVTFEVISAYVCNIDYLEVQATAEVTDVNAPATGDVTVNTLTLDKTSAALETDEHVKLTATVDPTNVTVAWSTSDEDVAIVKDGVVTAVGEGAATITATAGNKTATCDVTVTDYDAVSVIRCEAEDIPAEGFVAGKAGTPTVTEASGASGGAYIGNTYNNMGVRFTFSVNAEEACKARLVLGMGLSGALVDASFSSGLKVYVNDVEFTTKDPVVYTYQSWETFDRAVLGEADLKEGVNTITFEVVGINAGNMDYLEVQAMSAVTDVNVPAA